MKQQQNGEIARAVSHEVSFTAQRQEDTREKVSSSAAAQSTSEREAHSHMFISYSRNQFYFTESLALHLQKRQVETWFDVQRLVPGSDWQQSLHEGLANCAGLILVASGAALASAYVQNEWQAVLAAGKPIYVVLFEAVQLPPELSHAAAIVDFRGNFQRALSRLIQSIQMGTSYRDRLPNVNPLRLPTRLPMSLWFIMSVLWINVAVSVVLPIPVLQLLPHITTLIQEGRRETLLLFAIAYPGVLFYLIYYALAFTYRLSFVRYSEIKMSLLVGGPLALISGNLLVFQVMDQVLFSALWLVSFALIDILLLAVGVLAFFVIPRWDDTVRWFPPGMVPETLRMQKIADYSGLRWSEEGSGVARTYRLHHDPADECIADDVRQVFCGERNLSESRGEQTDVHLVILTSRTPLAWMSKLAHTLSNVVFIAASSGIRVPRDEESLRRFQWIDYRLRQKDQLLHARVLLCGPSSRASIYTHPAVPESLEQLVAPQRISWFCSSLTSVGVWTLAAGIASLVLLFQHSQQTLPGLLPVAALPSGCFLIWLSDRIKTWSISLIAVLIALGPALVGFFISGAVEAFFPTFGIGAEIIWLVELLILFVYADQTLLDWLPRSMSPFFRWKATLTIPFWKRGWPTRVLYMFVVIELILFVLLRPV
jgi:hypothetical protein